MCLCIHTYYVYIYIYICRRSWLPTNGVDTNGATAEVIDFLQIGKNIRPGTLGNIKVGLTGVPKKSLCQKT